MKKLIERLWVGDQKDCYKALEKGFAVASMLKEETGGHREALGYKTLGAPEGKNYYYVVKGKHFSANLIDVDDPSFIPEEVINPALDFIQEHYDKGENVLIHCEKGHSRGPTTCLMFLRKISDMPYSFTRSEKIFKTLYPKYDPSIGIRTYARTHWKGLNPNQNQDAD